VEPEPVLLRLNHVSKRFGSRVALRDISLTVGTRESVALLGANGAGKTTLLRTLATLARPTRGSVEAFGVEAWAERQQVRARLGVVAHQPYVYPELTCQENLRFFATMYALDDPMAAASVALERVGLAARAQERAGSLSRGLLQRLNLARALLHAPTVLILDEPDTGLDASGRAVLTAIVLEQVARGGSVVFTSHALDLALELATRVVVIVDGQLTLDTRRAAVTRGAVEELLREPARAGR
jgi:heme ABC exporter ATP-binding subunit CcmA